MPISLPSFSQSSDVKVNEPHEPGGPPITRLLALRAESLQDRDRLEHPARQDSRAAMRVSWGNETCNPNAIGVSEMLSPTLISAAIGRN